MSKIVIEEFDACHKFVDEIEFFVLPIEKRKFVEISHVVSCDKIVIVLLIVLILFLQYKKNVCIKHLDG